MTTLPRHRLRVLIFAGAYNHIVDGVAIVLNKLVSHLTDSGVDVRVVAPTGRIARMRHAGTLLPTVSIPAYGRPDYRVSLVLPVSVRQQIGRFDPDIVHVATPDFIGLWAVWWARRTGRIVVGSYHTHFPSYLGHYHLQWGEGIIWSWVRTVYNGCREVYATSPAMVETLTQHRLRNVRLWSRGIDTTLFNPSKRSMSWRRELGIGDDEIVVSYIGRLVKEKNLDHFARIVRSLEEEGVKFRSLIVGDGPMYEELKRTLSKTHFTGSLKGEELARAYASSDVFLFPSYSETFGLVVLEALASGLAVVSAKSGGAKSLIQHGNNGLLVREDEKHLFLRYVLQCIEDASLRNRLRQAARESARRHDSGAVCQEQQMLDYYQGMVEHERSNPNLWAQIYPYPESWEIRSRKH